MAMFVAIVVELTDAKIITGRYDIYNVYKLLLIKLLINNEHDFYNINGNLFCMLPNSRVTGVYSQVCYKHRWSYPVRIILSVSLMLLSNHLDGCWYHGDE